MFKTIKRYLKFIRAIPVSIIFCLRYLPFKQAIRIPIFLYKPDFQNLKGRVEIAANYIKPGMIRLGFRSTTLFPNCGIMWNVEGRVVFKGSCTIGNDSYILCGKSGNLIFGDNFNATGGFRVASYCKVEFGKNVLVGWGSVILDTDFHPLFDIRLSEYKKAYGDVNIGDGNWFACYCMVLHSVTTPKNCVFGARSFLARSISYSENCLYAGNPAILLRKGVRLDSRNRYIEYI